MIKIKIFEDLKSLESTEIYCLLRNYDLCVGECFIDYNENYINKTNLLFYLLGTREIVQDQINYFIRNELHKRLDLNEIFDELRFSYNARLKVLADISVNFDILLKRLFNAYQEYELGFEISEDLIEKIRPELKELY
jgi:hypothetical protein